MRFLKKSNIIFRICFLIIFLLLVFIFFFPNSKNFKYIQNKSIEYIGEINPKNYFINKKNTKKIRYFVQLGIFAKQSEVDKIRARMLLLGFDLNLKKIFFQGNIATKITLGPYDENILKDIEKILKKNNIKYLVINE